MLNDFPLSLRKALVIAGYSLGTSTLLRALDSSEAAPRFSAKTLASEVATEFEKDGLVAVDVAESKKTVRAFLERNPRKAKIVLMEDTNLSAVFAAKSFPTMC